MIFKESLGPQEIDPGFSVEKLLIAGNRGPCGGVNMAVEAVEQVLGIVQGREPVYTNWDIINNRPLMEELKSRGLVVFNNDWSRVPDGSIVFFSAHGIPPDFWEIAIRKRCAVVDITCQLVARVHNLVKRAEAQGKHVIYVGVENHPETRGVLGELRAGNYTLVQSVEDVAKINLGSEIPKIVYSQTTLSTDEIRDIMRLLRAQLGETIEIPARWDICYATDARQQAVEALIPKIDTLLVVGSKHSHNSQELRKKGELYNVPSYSVDFPQEIQPKWFNCRVRRVGITSGASVMERFTQDVICWFLERDQQIEVRFEEQVVAEKKMTFKLPQASIDMLKSRYC